MNNNELRTQLQNEAVETLRTKKRLILQWGTGVGKSRVAVRSINGVLECNPEAKVLLLVQETNHKKNWKNEFIEALGEERANDIFKKIKVECYASLPKYANTSWNFIAADEGHHLRSEKRIEILLSMKAERFLVLSATISEQGDGTDMLSALETTFGHFENLKYGINDAIESGVLPEPVFNVIPITMSEGMGKTYNKMTEYIEQTKTEYYQQRDNFNLPDNIENSTTQPYKERWMQAAMIRKRRTAAFKTRAAKELIANLKKENKRFICFCQELKQVEKLEGENYLSSKRTKKENAEVIDKFNNGEINSIFAVGMLQEGQNLKNIDAGIVIQLDNKARSFVQKIGRVMRGKKPVIYVYYIPDTQDEKYLANAFKDTKQEYINGWTKIEDNDNIEADLLTESSLKKRQRVDIKEISCTNLIGPSLIQDVYYRKDIFFLKPENGNIVGTYGNIPIFPCNTLQGQFKKVYVNPQTSCIELLLLLPDGKYCILSFFWKIAFGPLMQLASVIEPTEKSLFIITELKNGFTNVQLHLEQEKLKWISNKIPTQQDDRINFLNNLIELINA